MSKKEPFKISIRAHHLLCMQGYQGYGYDESFKNNLEEILDYLNLEKNIKVNIISSPDVLCDFCPHLKKKYCHLKISEDNKIPTNKEIQESNDNIVNMDLKVMKKCNIKSNKEYIIDEIFELINKRFLSLNDVDEICNGCIWINECLWYQERDN